MVVDVRRGAPHVRLEGGVKSASALPVAGESRELPRVHPGVELRAPGRGDDRSQRGLRGGARHGVDGAVDDVRARGGGGERRGDARSRRVVRVDRDGSLREALAQGRDEEGGRGGLEEARHVLVGWF